MAIIDRQSHTEEEQDCSPQIFFLEKQSQARQGYGHVGNDIRLRDMPRLNDNDIVRRQRKGYRPTECQPPARPHHAHQEVETQESNQHHSRIAIAQRLHRRLYPFILRQVGSRIAITRDVRHTTKHRVRPSRELSRLSRLFVLFHLAITHTVCLQHIALLDNFPVQHGRGEVGYRNHQQNGNGGQVLSQSLYYILCHTNDEL